MYKGISKITFAVMLAISLQSCGDKDRDAAESLYSRSEQAIEQKNYSEALALLDSLDTRYPKQTGVRRDALRLRASAMEGIAIDSIGAVDAELAQATMDVEKWAPLFRHVDSSVGLEGYFIPAKAKSNILNSTGIEARVSDEGYFYAVANVQKKSIGLRSIELVSGDDRVSSAEISPERLISVEGSEMASFNPEDLEALSRWLLTHPNPEKLVLVGSKSSVTVKLSAAQATELTDCAEYARAWRAKYLASLRREKFERMLATARDQLANMPQKNAE